MAKAGSSQSEDGGKLRVLEQWNLPRCGTGGYGRWPKQDQICVSYRKVSILALIAMEFRPAVSDPA